MKNLICLIAVFLCLNNVYGQTGCCPYLDSIQVYPANPSNTDSIKIFTKTTCPGLGNKISYQYTISNDTIFLDACFYSGPLAAIQEYYDTTVIAPLAIGTYTILYTAYLSSSPTDCSIKTDTNSISANLIVSGPNSVNLFNQELELLVYPNPSKKEIKLIAHQDKLIVYVYDTRGQKVFEQKFNQEILINLQNYQSGMYIISVENGKYKKSKTFLIE